MMITNWDKVNSYKMSAIELNLVAALFQELINTNDCFDIDDTSKLELDTLFFIFKHAWIVSTTLFDKKDKK